MLQYFQIDKIFLLQLLLTFLHNPYNLWIIITLVMIWCLKWVNITASQHLFVFLCFCYAQAYLIILIFENSISTSRLLQAQYTVWYSLNKVWRLCRRSHRDPLTATNWSQWCGGVPSSPHSRACFTRQISLVSASRNLCYESWCSFNCLLSFWKLQATCWKYLNLSQLKTN